MRILPALSLALLLAGPALAGDQAPKVLVSIAPLHSLAAAVMEGAGTPDLLMTGTASPHDFSLKPSQARLIRGADLVVWVGPELESFMVKPVTGLSAKGKLLTMSGIDGMTKLEVREGGPWEAHEHEHEHERHAANELEADGHLWLDIGNAKLIAEALAQRLSALDPKRAVIYKKNASDLAGRLDRQDATLKAELAPLAGKPYVVFHDAFQYFERRYGLTPLGSITLDERKPSAKTIARLRKKITELKARCVFKEPQAQARTAEMVAEGLNVRLGVLDDLGSDLDPGPGLYADLLKRLAANLRSCLADSTDK